LTTNPSPEKYVHCRIGSSEIAALAKNGIEGVHCRIGSSETIGLSPSSKRTGSVVLQHSAGQYPDLQNIQGQSIMMGTVNDPAVERTKPAFHNLVPDTTPGYLVVSTEDFIEPRLSHVRRSVLALSFRGGAIRHRGG